MPGYKCKVGARPALQSVIELVDRDFAVGWCNFSDTRLLALSTPKVTDCAVFSAWFSTDLRHSFAGGERRTAFEVCLPKHYAGAGRPSLSKGYLLFSGVPGNAERAAPGEEEKEAYDDIR